MKFRKKPIIIEAIQLNGKNEVEITNIFPQIKLCKPNIIIRFLDYIKREQKDKFYIKTMEGIMCASKSDWIIKGVKGEFYPCKPDIFTQSYEPVEEVKS